MKFDIILPNRTGKEENESFICESNVVFVGANGSGKTRLGTWIETALQDKYIVHRISAQRSLSIPEFAPMKNLEQAEKDLLYGRSDQHANNHHKTGSRWGNNPATFLLSDYEKLLSTLFAKSAKRDKEHSQQTEEKKAYIPRPDSPIEKIKKVWKDIMPHREIEFEDGKVTVKKEGQPEYHGKEMSDGERVALYLIGQCLTVPDNSIIIIDEPEIHLHKSLMARLWNKIEELSPNKLLIYITHDLDFAASRKGSQKIWIKSYDGENSWVWDNVPEIENIPEPLTIEIIGNRKNVLFTEGEKGSHDIAIYQAIYPDFHVVPRGGCAKVIESTKAIISSPSLHHITAYGIIDSDFRTPEEIKALLKAEIYTISVAEVENLFCIEPLIRIVAAHQLLDEDDTVKTVTEFIIQAMKDEFDLQVTSHAEREIQFRLNTYTKQDHTEKGLKDGLDIVIKNLSIEKIFSESKKLYESALNSKSLDKVLAIYNRKNLPSRISKLFKLKDGEYPELLLRLLKSDKKEPIIQAIKKHTPELNITDKKIAVAVAEIPVQN